MEVSMCRYLATQAVHSDPGTRPVPSHSGHATSYALSTPTGLPLRSSGEWRTAGQPAMGRTPSIQSSSRSSFLQVATADTLGQLLPTSDDFLPIDLQVSPFGAWLGG